MNKLVLIGNGFDLAHGLKTRYSDFILWYLKSVMEVLMERPLYKDNLLIAERNDYLNTKPDFNSLDEFRRFLKENKYFQFRFKFEFITRLVFNSNEPNWVDIESKYYEFLTQIYLKYVEAKEFKKEQYIAEVVSLNECFGFIKEKLIEYLKIIDSGTKGINPEIEDHFISEFQTPAGSIEKTMFLNFNYTNTLDKYTATLGPDVNKVNNIHGMLNDPSNPIIFGYGDEMDSYYSKIEEINNNEFLKNFKSFSYFQTINYLDFLRFIDSTTFTVYIVGHSCGLSDKILLNSIFEHKKCRSIKIFYHQKNETKDDFFEKTQDISRHFSSNNKGLMRRIIIPKVKSKPLIRFN